MHQNDAPRVIARNWIVVLLITVLGAAGAYAYAKVTATYTAISAVNIVGQQVVSPDKAEQVTNYIAAEMSVYESLASSPEVLTQAANQAGVSISPEDLNAATKIEATGQTLQFTVTADSAGEASKLAAALAATVATEINNRHAVAYNVNQVDEAGNPIDSNGNIISLVPVVKASSSTELAPAASLTNSAMRTAVLGGLLGLVLGCLLVIVIHLVRGRVESGRTLARATDELVFAGEQDTPTQEVAKQVRAVIEGNGDARPNLIVVAGATVDDAANQLAGDLAKVYVEDGLKVQLVGQTGMSAPSELDFRAQDLTTIPAQDLRTLSAADSTLKIVAAPAITTHADALRLAQHADHVVLAVDTDEKLKAVLQAGDLLRAAEASLTGYVVS